MDIFERLGYKDNIKPYGKRIAKTHLFMQGGLNKADRELLTEKVEDIKLEYVFNKYTYPMAEVVTEEECYDAIFIVKVILRTGSSLNKLSKIIQAVLPTHTIIVFEKNNEYLFSSALKRFNKAEKGKTVAEEFHFGKWINLCSTSDSDNHFFDTIMYGSLPTLDYKQAYITLHQAIYRQANAETTIDIKAENFEEYKIKAEQKKKIQLEINQLVRLLNNKSTSLKEKIGIATKVEQLKKIIIKK